MAASAQFYLDQAAICEKAASVALLDNQRETLMRSHAAWMALANRELKIQAERIKRDRERIQAQQKEPTHV
ncbi:MAG TPA: hypothetical protein PK479_04580 [Novosphingobium sp.]|nr:hypothetical protein [Novosphingobium sp.]HNN55209.1 hypothetical protein [Novosphingobium sp.]